MPEKKFDVLVVGELNVDLIMNQLEKFPELGKEIIARKMMLTLGSSSAIFASNLSVLGSRVSFCGRVGKDAFAKKVIGDLQSKGVHTGNIVASDSADTGITVALNAGENRAMVTYPGAMDELTADDISDEMLDSAAHLHVSSVFLQPGLRPGLAGLFERARSRGLTTSFDPQWDPAEKWDCGLDRLLVHLNIFLPNLEELKHLMNKTSEKECHAALRGTTGMVALKKGSDGAELWMQENIIPQPAFLNTRVVDAIGAGDSFNAGFIHRFVQGQSPEQCLQFGALCGAINTTAAGGTTAFSDYASVQQVAAGPIQYQNMTLKDKLIACTASGSALLAVNFYNFETLKGLLLAAKAANRFLILQLSESSLDYMGIAPAAAMARAMLKEHQVDGWLHLDHGSSVAVVKKCLDAGFDSVMIDASEQSFEENVRITKEAVAIAAAYGANVEAELGYVAKLGQDQTAEPTSAADAKRFAEATGINALAVAIGNAHGFYKAPPNLRLDRLREIRSVTSCALVLHGSSGIPDDQLQEAIRSGISKINLATETKNTFMKKLQSLLANSDEIDLRKVFPKAIAEVEQLITRKLKVISL